MNRREQLIASVIGKDLDPQKAAFLDTTIKFILADQGEQYLKFWQLKGPGVMRLIPTQERDAWCTLEDLREDIRLCESLNNDDLGETLKRILDKAEQIDPKRVAGYMILDNEGIRYIEIDYTNPETIDTAPCSLN
jgi:hypothetical protein|tara:strand:+ start:2823 stop:3227 length:405 start_codon:yes stop_codon:yes gene_type:complete